MKLTVPPLPPILVGSSEKLFRRWFGFWSLPLEYKADIVDAYPSLLIERPRPSYGDNGPKLRVFFDPGVFDTQVPDNVVFQCYSNITFSEGFYPLQKGGIGWEDQPKEMLMKALHSLNFALLAYKYRYSVRPEDYTFDMDFHAALCAAATEQELLTFYERSAHP